MLAFISNKLEILFLKQNLKQSFLHTKIRLWEYQKTSHSDMGIYIRCFWHSPKKFFENEKLQSVKRFFPLSSKYLALSCLTCLGWSNVRSAGSGGTISRCGSRPCLCSSGICEPQAFPIWGPRPESEHCVSTSMVCSHVW